MRNPWSMPEIKMKILDPEIWNVPHYQLRHGVISELSIARQLILIIFETRSDQ